MRDELLEFSGREVDLVEQRSSARPPPQPRLYPQQTGNLCRLTKPNTRVCGTCSRPPSQYSASSSPAERAAYLNEAVLESAVERKLEIIGEAARKLSAAFQQSHPEIPWSKITGQRGACLAR